MTNETKLTDADLYLFKFADRVYCCMNHQDIGLHYSAGLEYVLYELQAFDLLDEIAAGLKSWAFHLAAKSSHSLLSRHRWILRTTADGDLVLTGSSCQERSFYQKTIPGSIAPLERIDIVAIDEEDGWHLYLFNER